MPLYDIGCKNCDYTATWNCTIEKYEKQLKLSCPNCGKKGMYQDFSTRKKLTVQFIGYGWNQGKTIRKNSEEDLSDALRENDYLLDRSRKYDHIDDRVIKGHRDKHGIQK